MTGRERKLLQMAHEHLQRAKIIVGALAQSPHDTDMADACAFIAADIVSATEGVVAQIHKH